MLEIILTILKFAAIGIGILFVILLLLLLVVLIVPVRYDFKVQNTDKLQGKGKIHWLFHIVTFHISYENDEMRQMLRIFGVPVWKK